MCVIIMNYHFQMPDEEVQQVEVWFTDCDSDSVDGRQQSSTINAASPELRQDM